MPESYSFLIKVNKKEQLIRTLNKVEKNVHSAKMTNMLSMFQMIMILH